MPAAGGPPGAQIDPVRPVGVPARQDGPAGLLGSFVGLMREKAEDSGAKDARLDRSLRPDNLFPRDFHVFRVCQRSPSHCDWTVGTRSSASPRHARPVTQGGHIADLARRRGARRDAPRSYVLRFISGKYQGGEFPVAPEKQILIGRSSDLDMVLVEDMVIAQARAHRHAGRPESGSRTSAPRTAPSSTARRSSGRA